MELDLKKLRQLVTVARIGSVSQAAEVLHITQPALSRSISALEEQLGIQVFDRGRNGVTLTKLGKLAVEEAESLLARSKLLQRNLRLYQQGQAGSVAFGMGPLIGSLALPGLSAYLVNTYPQLKARAAVKAVDMLAEELDRGDIEMIFSGQAMLPVTEHLQLELIGRIPMAFLVCADHPLLQQKQVTRMDLLAYTSLCAVEMERFIPSSRGTFICDNYDILRSTAQHSNGIWVSSPLMAREEIEAGTLRELKLTDSSTQTQVIEVYMARLQESRLSPAAELVASFMGDFFRDIGSGS